jgi:hypothetical protein
MPHVYRCNSSVGHRTRHKIPGVGLQKFATDPVEKASLASTPLHAATSTSSTGTRDRCGDRSYGQGVTLTGHALFEKTWQKTWLSIPGHADEGWRCEGTSRRRVALRDHAHYSRHVSAVCFNTLFWQQYSLRPSFLP